MRPSEGSSDGQLRGLPAAGGPPDGWGYHPGPGVTDHRQPLQQPPPSGAEAAIDAALGGVISRRAARGALDTHFGATTFLPAINSHLAATAVMIVGLGERERFSADRLPEVGMAIVEAVAAFGFREAATVLHGAGSDRVQPRQAAHLLMEGLLDALARVPGAGCLRELMIVEYLGKAPDAKARDRMDAIAQGIRDADGPSAGIHCFFERSPDLVGPVRVEPGAPGQETNSHRIPEHLRLGIRSENRRLRLTLIGHGSLDCEEDYPYRVEMVAKIQKHLREEVLQTTNAEHRTQSLRSIGEQLYKTFFLDKFAQGQLKEEEIRKKMLVMGVNALNSDLPWELLCDGAGFLSRERVFSRVLGTKQPGREAALPSPDAGLNVLVVSDPTGDLAASAKEANQLVAKLKGLPSVHVEHLHGPEATYSNVYDKLDAIRHDVLHYAGHFAFDALCPGTSGLQLADGMLTADDLSTRPEIPRFFFANACESARVSGGLPPNGADLPFDQQGLAEGLLRQGVRAFLGSLWRVDDRAAETFALALYRALLKGQSLGEAVRLARIAVVKRHGEGQPAWASYALYGQPWMTLL